MTAVFDGFTDTAQPLPPPMVKRDTTRLLFGIEQILKSGADGELRTIARRTYLDITNDNEAPK